MSAILENLMVLLLIGFYLVLLAFAGLFLFFVIDRAVTGIFLTGIDKRLGPLWQVEAKINLLLKHAGIEFDPYKSLPQERADATGRKEVQRRVEAKINLLLEHAGIEFDPYKSLPQKIADAIGRGQKIRAIQIWRSATGVSLKEAKDFIEEVQRRSAMSGHG